MMNERLKGKLAEKGAKRIEIAALLKIAKPTVTNKLKGTQPITIKEFMSLAEHYKFSKKDILYILCGDE